jgi:hypothetical protein
MTPEEKLIQARKRHGKPFKTNALVKRVNTPSRFLNDLNELNKQKPVIRIIREER